MLGEGSLFRACEATGPKPATMHSIPATTGHHDFKTIANRCRGRLKTPFWKAAAEHYVERLVRWRAFTESIIKDGDPSLPIVDRNALEGKGILSALSASDIPVVLDERGKTFTSRQFSVFLERLSENASRRPCFIIGGAFGLDDSVKQAASHLIALGPLTMTHELARVVLFEQLYRAESLTRGLPYHH